MLAVVVLLGPVLSAAVFLHDLQRARLTVREKFQSDAAAMFGTLSEEVEECVTTAASVADLFSSFDHVDRQRFGDFARRHLARAPTLRALVWAPRVSSEDRRRFEAIARREWGPGFAISDPAGGARTRPPAAVRTEYFPVYYRESFVGVEEARVVGLDLAAVPANRDAFDRARDSGEPAMTSPRRTTEGGKSLHVYWPVYRSGTPHSTTAERRGALLGFVGAVFHLDAVMAYSIRQVMPDGFDVVLVDEGASPQDRVLESRVASSPDLAGVWWGGRLLADRIRAPLRWAGVMEVGGRHWRLTLAPRAGYVRARIPGDIWEEASIWLVVATLFSGYLVLLVRRANDVERLVASRTRELQSAHDQLLEQITVRARAESMARRLAHKLLSVQEEERRHLSRELHDEAGQSLTGLVLHLRLLQQELQVPDHMKARFREAEAMARTTLERVRLAVRDLRPPALDILGLTASLRGLCEDVGRRAKLPIVFTAAGDISSLPTTHSVCLYRIVQEALTNAARYAGATRVAVVLEATSEWVVLSIEDDGRGFDADAASPAAGGVGLIGMRERVESVGGALEIASRPGQGTRLEARVPAVSAPPLAVRAQTNERNLHPQPVG